MAGMEPVELVVFVGIQASGKTTYYRRHLAESHAHVSLDTWRGKGNVRAKERAAIMAALAAAADSAGATRGVVVDNTNVTAAARRRYGTYAADFARQAGCRARLVAYFFDADLPGCLARNQQRPPPDQVPPPAPYFVPPAAIAAFAQRLEPPEFDEGFERIVRVRVAGEDFQTEEFRPEGGA